MIGFDEHVLEPGVRRSLTSHQGRGSRALADLNITAATVSSNNGTLDRVTLVDMNTGAVLATYERSGATWTRLP